MAKNGEKWRKKAKNGDGEFAFFICQIRHFAIGSPPPPNNIQIDNSRQLLLVTTCYVPELLGYITNRNQVSTILKTRCHGNQSYND